MNERLKDNLLNTVIHYEYFSPRLVTDGGSE